MKSEKLKIVKGITIFAFTVIMFATAPHALAHVIVHPSTVGVAAIQEFSMSAPSEKDVPTVTIKLLIPDGLQMVVPNAKAGWTITVKKNGTGDAAPVTEIEWTNGSIPPGQRDDFPFQAQVPAKETTLNWKAYQTYQDGSVVAWDHAPSKDPNDDSAPPPYSMTKVVNDLSGSATNNQPMTTGSKKESLAFALSAAAIALSLLSLAVALRKK